MSRRRGVCHYCPAPATTRDHIVPKSRGGPNRVWNFVPACKPCNQKKGNDWPTCECFICTNARHMFAGWNPRWGTSRNRPLKPPVPESRPVGNAKDYFDELMADTRRRREADEAIARQKWRNTACGPIADHSADGLEGTDPAR